GVQRGLDRRLIALVTRRKKEEIRSPVLIVGEPDAERRVIGLGVRGMVLDEILVSGGGKGVVVGIEAHVGQRQLGQRRVLRVWEAVPDSLEVARGLEGVLILLLLHAPLVRAGGVRRLLGV